MGVQSKINKVRKAKEVSLADSNNFLVLLQQLTVKIIFIRFDLPFCLFDSDYWKYIKKKIFSYPISSIVLKY